MWSRLGSSYSPEDLIDAVNEQTLIDFRGTLRPVEDLALLRAEMAEWPGRGDLRAWQEHRRDWVATNNACRRDILERLRADGPLPARELPDTCVKPWTSGPASRLWWRVYAASGGSTPPCSDARSRAVPPCCRRSTGSSTTASA
jgi:hypothetical protein